MSVTRENEQVKKSPSTLRAPYGTLQMGVDSNDIARFIAVGSNGALKLDVSDIQIGAVEIKDGTTDNRVVVNDTGQLHTVMRGFCNTGNSTDIPLPADTGGIDHIFTGTSIDTLDYATVTIWVNSDVASAIDGLIVQYSTDELDWHDGEKYTIRANSKKFYTPTLQLRYMRIIYTNGIVAQTTFHLHTVLRKSTIKWSSHNITDPILDEDDAQLTKSVITGKRADGIYDNVNLTNGNNLKVSLEEFESGISSNSNSQLNTTIFNSLGSEIDTHYDASGDAHLGTSIIQTIITSTNNYTNTNLASGSTFTGTTDETFGINGIQVFHTADQDCNIYIDQSTDDTFADSTKIYTSTTECLANVPCARVIGSIAPYYRLRVTNNGGSTTTKLETATGMTPVISTLPTELSYDGRLKSESTLAGKENTDRHVWVSPTNSLGTNTTVRLVGTNFDGTIKDTNFWTETVTNGGTVVQTGEIKLQTNTTANGTATYESVRRARFVVGSALQFTGAFKFNDTVTEADNLRRLGAYDDDNGFFFQLDSGVFSVGSRKATSDTLVNSGDFNGNYGPNFTPSATEYYKFDIEYTPLGAFYYINGKLLHKSVGGHLTRFLTLPIRFENINDNGNATAVIMDCLGVVIIRLGELGTNPTYKYIAGAATTICKVGAGDLHTIVNNDNSGSMIVYDNTVGSGTIIASVDLAKVLGTLKFDAPFSNGLTIVTTGAGAKITVTYE